MNADLEIACNPLRENAVRHAAWQRYENAQWLDAYENRGLELGQLDRLERERVYALIVANALAMNRPNPFVTL